MSESVDELEGEEKDAEEFLPLQEPLGEADARLYVEESLYRTLRDVYDRHAAARRDLGEEPLAFDTFAFNYTTTGPGEVLVRSDDRDRMEVGVHITPDTWASIHTTAHTLAEKGDLKPGEAFRQAVEAHVEVVPSPIVESEEKDASDVFDDVE